MEKTTNEPRTLILSTRLYRALLAVYPSEFRQAYGSPMQQVFRDCCRRAQSEAGTLGLLALWARTMLDTLQTAVEEHVQRGVDMSKEKFIRLSGWALMIGGLGLLLAWLAGTRPEYNQFNARSLPIDRYANAVQDPLMVMSMLLLAVGFTGLFLKYGPQVGSFGRASLGLSALSGIVGVVGAIGLSFTDNDPWWSLFFVGLLFEFLGLALFGMANLREQTMPRLNGLPLLVGLLIPMYAIAGIIAEQASGSWVEWPVTVEIVLWLFTSAGLIGLGYLLQSDRPLPAGGSARAV